MAARAYSWNPIGNKAIVTSWRLPPRTPRLPVSRSVRPVQMEMSQIRGAARIVEAPAAEPWRELAEGRGVDAARVRLPSPPCGAPPATVAGSRRLDRSHLGGSRRTACRCARARHRRTRRGRRPNGHGRQRSVRGTVLSRSEPGGTDAHDDTRGSRRRVGIVGNAVHESIRGPIRRIVYLPMAQEPLQSLFVAGAFIAVRSEAASPERLSRSLAAALESVDPDVRVSFLTGTGIVDFALARDRLVARLATSVVCSLVAHGSRIGWGDGVPGDVTAPRGRGSRRAREHTQPAGRAGPLACAETRGRGCGRRSGTRSVNVTDGGVDAVRRRAPGPGRLRRRRRHDHGRRSARRLVPAYRASRLDPARALTRT